jgi:phosphatidylglycerol---prolipoprotein diacylglyceryl transferase
MFVNNINPVLLHLGNLEIRYYGIVYAIGFLIGYLLLRRFIKSKSIKLTEEQLDTYFVWLILGSVLMARLFEVFIYNPGYYLAHFSESYIIWNGGLSFQGGIVGAIIITLIFAKKYKIHFYDIADILIIPTTLVLAVGKLANYTNSELYGTITNVSWCVVFQKIDMYCRHPVQIYEFILYLALFAALWIYYTHTHDEKNHKKNKTGRVFWIFIISYSIIRFLVAFLRDEPLYAGLNMGQWLSIITMLVAVIFFWKIWKTESKSI